MSMELHIKRLPRAFDPELGQSARDVVRGIPFVCGELIAGAAGSSPYLNKLIHALADWLPAALHDPERVLKVEQKALMETPPDLIPSALRKAKAQHAIIIALADLAGAWTTERVARCWTEFADLACDLALKAALIPLIRKARLPSQTEDDLSSGAGICVFAMGKMGAFELNYSSDIDLICFFDETRYGPDTSFKIRADLVRAVKMMCTILNEHTSDGYVFRTDLRLRPDPSVTPVLISMEAAERYYESFGRTWERAVFIKARPCAGDVEAGERFLKSLTPFIWRKYLDFAAVEDTQAMRLKIRSQNSTSKSIEVLGHDMKLGLGGIREIEFFTQTRQLIAGGRDQSLRDRGTAASLSKLAARGWIPTEVSDRLIENYWFHRNIEHRVQMVHDARTHAIPPCADGLERIACLSDCDSDQLSKNIKMRLEDVHALTEGFFVPSVDWEEQDAGYSLPSDVLERWYSFPAFRSERAQSVFENLKSQLIARISKTARPEQTVVYLERFFSGLPSGLQIFSLFHANPRILDLLVDITGTSSSLADYLSRNASVFDAVVDGDFFSEWPGEENLRLNLEVRLACEDDYESKLDAARSWAKEWHFRIGVHHLRGLLEYDKVGEYYADLAGAVMSGIWPVVIDQFAIKHGRPLGRGVVILGLGSLGSRRMTATSDLDLILIYDAPSDGVSDGPRPLPAKTYYANLTRAMITALSAPTSQGKLYSVDMRLRPSGNKGPVATSFESFKSYQQQEAWIWEHLALTHARVVTGPEDFSKEVEIFRSRLLARPVDCREVFQAVREMRSRLDEAKKPDGVWDTKTGAGRLQDLDLIAQANALISERCGNNPLDIFAGKIDSDWLTCDDVRILSDCYWKFLRVLFAVRLLFPNSISEELSEDGDGAFLKRVVGSSSLAELQDALREDYDRASLIIDDMLSRGVADE